MKNLQKDVLDLLIRDARLTEKEISTLLGVSETEVKACIATLEKSGTIIGYTAIVNSEKADETVVEALIEVKVTPKSVEGFDGIAKRIAEFSEVKGVYLMSGAYDLAVFLKDTSLQKVARFVSEHISTFEGVISTATHFILKKYKIEGTITEKDEDRRILVQA